MAKATSKLDVYKILLPLNLASKRDDVYKNERANKIPIYLQDKVNKPLDYFQQNVFISLVNLKQ